MIIDCEQLNSMISEVAKKCGVDIDKEPIDALSKKIENNNLYYTVECKEINVLNPGIKSAFFFKNAEIEITNPNLIFGNFDKEMIAKIKLVKDKVQLFDIDNNKFECNKKDVHVRLKEIPIDLFFNLLG